MKWCRASRRRSRREPCGHRADRSSPCVGRGAGDGHEKGEQAESKLDYAALAKFPGTLVFYMGVTSAPHWTAELMAAGMSPTMPVAVIPPL